MLVQLFVREDLSWAVRFTVISHSTLVVSLNDRWQFRRQHALQQVLCTICKAFQQPTSTQQLWTETFSKVMYSQKHSMEQQLHKTCASRKLTLWNNRDMTRPLTGKVYGLLGPAMQHRLVTVAVDPPATTSCARVPRSGPCGLGGKRNHSANVHAAGASLPMHGASTFCAERHRCCDVMKIPEAGPISPADQKEEKLDPVRKDVAFHTRLAPESDSGNKLPDKVFVE